MMATGPGRASAAARALKKSRMLAGSAAASASARTSASERSPMMAAIWRRLCSMISVRVAVMLAIVAACAVGGLPGSALAQDDGGWQPVPPRGATPASPQEEAPEPAPAPETAPREGPPVPEGDSDGAPDEGS